MDRVSGLVQVFEKVIEDENGKGIRKRLPYTSFATFQECVDKPQSQVEMVPNSRYKSLLYFEDQGVTSPIWERAGFKYTSRIRLVCWLNTKLIAGQSNMLLSAQIINDIIGKLVIANEFHVQPFTRISVRVANIPQQDKGIFSKYDYSEVETQYLMPPFEYFAIDFNVYYTIPKDCLPPIETSLDPCSILNQLFPCNGFQDEDEGKDYYEKILPAGTSIVIPLSEHLVNRIRGVTVLNAVRDETDVYTNISNDKDITIETNLSFEDYKVVIF